MARIKLVRLCDVPSCPTEQSTCIWVIVRHFGPGATSSRKLVLHMAQSLTFARFLMSVPHAPPVSCSSFEARRPFIPILDCGGGGLTAVRWKGAATPPKSSRVAHPSGRPFIGSRQHRSAHDIPSVGGVVQLLMLGWWFQFLPRKKYRTYGFFVGQCQSMIRGV